MYKPYFRENLSQIPPLCFVEAACMLVEYGPEAGYISDNYDYDLLVLFRALLHIALTCSDQEFQLEEQAENARLWVENHKFYKSNYSSIPRALGTAISATQNYDADDASFLFELSEAHYEGQIDPSIRISELGELIISSDDLWAGKQHLQAYQKTNFPEGKRIFDKFFVGLNSPMTFWVDWYKGLLDDHEPDWELWHDIVLIDDEHWNAGPEAVAREIEILQAAHDLEGKIEQFEAQLLQLASEPIFEGNRDNGGPPLENHQARLATIQLITAQLDILKAEVAKAKPVSDEEPDPEVIETAIQKIMGYVKKYFIIGVVGIVGTAFVAQTAEVGFSRYRVHEKLFEKLESIATSTQKLLGKLGARLDPIPKTSKSKPNMKNPTIDI